MEANIPATDQTVFTLTVYNDSSTSECAKLATGCSTERLIDVCGMRDWSHECYAHVCQVGGMLNTIRCFALQKILRSLE